MSELRPIGQKATMAETMIAIKTQAWIFEKPIEKLIIAGCFGWSVFSLLKFIFNLIT